MKKILSVMLLLTMFTTAACSTGSKINESESTTQATVATEPTEAVKDNSDIKSGIDEVLKKCDFEGIVYLAKNGEVVYQSATGINENEEPVTVDTPMPVGSVSKQFCAAAILMLRDQGKLSLDDTLSKYFPEYEIGKDITLKQLLSMQSGIYDMVNEGVVDDMSADNSEEANTEIIKNWIFSQELKFEPGSTTSYSNSNYFLLGNIVEQVSGEKYMDFLRENIFTPLGMNNTGSIEEAVDSPAWLNGETFDSLEDAKMRGLTKGAGNLISTARDMDLWLTALRGGKVISPDSYKEMTTNYADQIANQYGYGLIPGIYGGVWHSGGIGRYFAFDYTNADEGYNLFVASNTATPAKVATLHMDLLRVVLG